MNNRKMIQHYDAWFLNVTDKHWIVPVPCRHILTLLKEHKLFGIDIEEAKRKYQEANQTVGSEGSVRDHYLQLVMKEGGVIRIRYYRKSGLWRLQMYDTLSTKQKESISKFIHALETRQISDLFDYSKNNPNFEIYSDNRIFFGTADMLKNFLKK